MGPLAILTLLTGSLFLSVLQNDDDTTGRDTQDTGDTDNEDPAETGSEFDVTESGTYLGTAGDDVVAISNFPGLVELDTGDGNDTIQSAETENGGPDTRQSGTEIHAGAGDDVVTFDADEQNSVHRIYGGDGNDTLITTGSTAYGEAGDDLVQVSSYSGDPAFGYGGEGNDTLQSMAAPTTLGTNTASDNVFLSGGAGDDLIYLYGPSDSGAGYGESGDGGMGDDTIVMSTASPTDDFGYIYGGPLYATGGEGADTFLLRAQDSLPEEFEVEVELVIDGFRLSDFEPGVDRIQVEADAITQGGVLARAGLSETTNINGEVTTSLTLVYESETQPAMSIVAKISGAGVTWDDIEFIGAQIPTLSPAA